MFMTIYAGIIGLLVGSAINAIVWRLNVGRSWAKGRSECPECNHVLAAKDLIPVLSWLWLRGKCRYCKAPIKDSPIVEAVTAALFALSIWRLGPESAGDWLLAGMWLVMLTLLIILAVYDARWMILPDKIMLPAIVLGLVWVGLSAWQWQSWDAVRGPLIAAFGAGGAFFALVAGSRGRAMGGGDIKLVFLMGLLLGAKSLILALFLAFNVAAIVGLGLIVTKIKRRRDHIPFGPFLVGATVVAFLYGNDIVTWYLGLIGLA